MVYCLHELEYVDDAVIGTLERYVRARGCQIAERDLMATLCDYCLDFRVRSPALLEGAAEYLIEHGPALTTPQLYSIARVFGELNFHPPNGFRFFEVLEQVLELKFAEFPPREALNLLLSFVYLERYPLNFVRKVFNPYFMDRLHQQGRVAVLQSRMQLKLFDVAMNEGAPGYGGPYMTKGGGGGAGAQQQM